MRMTFVAILGALAVVHAAPAGAAKESVDAFVKREMHGQKIPGMSIAILKSGKLFKIGNYGHANLEHMVPVTQRTLFQTASVGKQFTAGAVQILVRDGKLTLDDPVERHIPGLPAAWKTMTVRHLLSNTSGLGGYPQGFDWRRTWSEGELVAFIKDQSLSFQPGSNWQYSNLGYVLLGAIIRSASGQYFGDFLKQHVFTPAGMGTAHVIDETAITPGRAAGYYLEKGIVKNQQWVSPSLNTTADGALYASMNDLVAWDRALVRASVLNRKELTEAWSAIRLSTGATRPYGFGWALAKENGHRIVEHSGRWQGFSSHILRYPDRNVTVIVLANLADVPTGVFARKLAGLADPALAAPVRRYIDLPPSILQDYVGKYALSRTMTLEVSLKDGALFAWSKGQEPLRMQIEAKDRFFVEEIAAPIVFVRGPDGMITHLVLEQGGAHRAEKLD